MVLIVLVAPGIVSGPENIFDWIADHISNFAFKIILATPLAFCTFSLNLEPTTEKRCSKLLFLLFFIMGLFSPFWLFIPLLFCKGFFVFELSYL